MCCDCTVWPRAEITSKLHDVNKPTPPPRLVGRYKEMTEHLTFMKWHSFTNGGLMGKVPRQIHYLNEWQIRIRIVLFCLLPGKSHTSHLGASCFFLLFLWCLQPVRMEDFFFFFVQAEVQTTRRSFIDKERQKQNKTPSKINTNN